MVIFDVEASGLSDQSYPIEIAWQDRDDESCFDSFLIIPHDSWNYWDEYAEKEIHHISREKLSSEGISIREACSRLNDRLKGKTIYSDAIEYDQRWIQKLFDQASVKTEFSFGSIFDCITTQEIFDVKDTIECEEIAHRALEDVRQIIRCLYG